MCTCSDDRRAIIWDFHEGLELRRLEKHSKAVYGATFFGPGPQEQYNVATACFDQKIRVFDKGVEGLDSAPEYASYGDLLTLRHGDILVPHIPMREPLRTLCEHFLDAIDQGTTPLTDGANGVDVLRVLDAAQRSLDAGGVPVSIDDDGEPE